MRPRVFLALVAAFALALMASFPAGAAAPVKVGIAYDGSGPGDAGYNDLARAGALRAQGDFGIKLFEAAPTLASGKEISRHSLLISLARRSKLVVAVGFLYEEAVGVVASRSPGTNFALIDSETSGGANLLVATFAESEGSFLVGAAAAMKSDKLRFGFIGGVDIPVIFEFEEGYVAGVQHVKAAQVDVEFVTRLPDFSGFNDPDGAYAIAMDMYASGIDVIFHAAGNSGIGLFQAARDFSTAQGTQVWAIGVDVDQYAQVGDDLKPFILTSMLKRVDVATYDIIRSQVEGTFTGGRHLVWDLEANGVGYATSGGYLDEYSDELGDIEDGIKSGSIVVP